MLRCTRVALSHSTNSKRLRLEVPGPENDFTIEQKLKSDINKLIRTKLVQHLPSDSRERNANINPDKKLKSFDIKVIKSLNPAQEREEEETELQEELKQIEQLKSKKLDPIEKEGLKKRETLAKMTENIRALFDQRNMDNQEFDRAGLAKRIKTWGKAWRVFPDLLEAPFLPKVNLLVEFGEELVQRGNFIHLSATFQRPIFSFPADETPENSLWTLVMVDLDHKEWFAQKARRKEYLHWLVGNIPGSDLSAGQNITDYIPPTLPASDEEHRYAFVLCLQTNRIDFGAEYKRASGDLEGRDQFVFKSFVGHHNLQPLGLSFFQAKWDPIAIKQVYSVLPQLELKDVLNVAVSKKKIASHARALSIQ